MKRASPQGRSALNFGAQQGDQPLLKSSFRGNHPNLVASVDKATGDLLFRCMGAGANFQACASTNHMHDVRYHLEGDSLTATWHSMKDGKLGDDLVFSLVRQS